MNNEDNHEQALDDIQQIYFELSPSHESYDAFYQKITRAKLIEKLPVKEVLLLAIALLQDGVANDAWCE